MKLNLLLLMTGLVLMQASRSRGQEVQIPPEGQAAPVTTVDVPGLKRRAQEIPLLRNEARLVSMDVTVTDKHGDTVPGLAAEDFQVREDGALQRVKNIEVHERPTNLAARPKLGPNTWSDAAPAAESSAIVLVLDTLDSPSVTDQMLLRQEMISYMKTVPEGTRIAILQLDTQLHMIEGFSGDSDGLLQAVKGKRDQPKFSVLPKPYALAMPMGIASGGELAAANTTGIPTITAQMNDSRRNEILSQAMPELMKFLGGIPGRKSVAWFYSLGAPSDRANDLAMKTMFDSDTTSFVDAMSRTTEVLTLSHIALYMVNIAGVGPLAIENAEMDAMAKAQGAQAIYGTNDLKGVIAHVADKAWNYYTLYYTPSNAVFDGGFRKVQVEVNRTDVQAQYRPGYYALDDSIQRARHAAALRKAQTTSGVTSAVSGSGTIGDAMAMGAPTPRDVQFTAHVDPVRELEKISKNVPAPKNNFLEAKYRKDKFREYRITYNVDAATLKFFKGFNGETLGSLDLVAVVYDDRGLTVNSVVSKASVHATPAMFKRLQAGGVQVEQTIAIPAKGVFFLRLGVHDKTADKAGALEVASDEIKLNVP